MSSPRMDLEHIDRLLLSRLREAPVPGVSVALIREGRMIEAKGYGLADAGTGAPIDAGTVFEAASLSKPLFAFAVLQLCREGGLDLDRPLVEYRPEPIVPADPRSRTITARMVLSHTSGLVHWLWDPGDEIRLLFAPGQGFSYSSLGLRYLQDVVEFVTGEALAPRMARVLRGLGMEHSNYVWQEEYAQTAAAGHDDQGRPVAKWRPERAESYASLHTTPTEYARYVLAMMSSRPEAAEMLTPQAACGDRVWWGLGWGLERHEPSQAFWHWGDMGVFKAFALGARAQGEGLVVMANGAGGLPLCEVLVRAWIRGDHPAFAWLTDFYRA